MKAVKSLSGPAIAAAAATLFLTGCASMHDGGKKQAAAGETIHCVGVNSCKGTSSCKTANSSCKGQNACKGQGFVALTPEVCEQVGGEAG